VAKLFFDSETLSESVYAIFVADHKLVGLLFKFHGPFGDFELKGLVHGLKLPEVRSEMFEGWEEHQDAD